MDFAAIKAQLTELKPDELKELVGWVEEECGVKVSGDSAGIVPLIIPTEKDTPAQTEFTVELTGVVEPSKKINVIKIVREITNLGIKEAKDLVDGAPKNIMENLSREQADAVKAKLEAAGGKVEVR